MISIVLKKARNMIEAFRVKYSFKLSKSNIFRVEHRQERSHPNECNVQEALPSS